MAKAGEPPLVYLDTSVWLQTIKGDEPHDMSDRVILAASQGRINLVASWLVRAEIQTSAVSSVPQETVDAVTRLLDSEGVRWVEVDRFIANTAVEISATLTKRLGGADAVHLATAVQEHAAYFMALDRGFPYGQTVRGVEVVEPSLVWGEDLFDALRDEADPA